MKNNEILKTEKIENLGYVIEANYFENYIIARCMNLNSKSIKPVFAYRFNNEKNLLDYALDFFKRVQERIDSKKRNQEIKKQAIENFENPYKIDDILYASWGYEQTNIDFYQVVEVKNKSIVIRKIGGELTGVSHGPDSGYIRPLLNEFIGGPEVKKIVTRVYCGNVSHYVSSPVRGSLSVYSSGEKGLYCSWGY